MKLLKFAGVAAVGVLMAACSHNNSGANGAGGMGSDANSYGAVGGSGYQTTADGRIINSMYAPANQTYYFDFDSNSINPSDYRAMNIQATYLTTHPNAQIRLEGNTDDRGSREYNVGLGWRRAQAVQRYFVQQGVAANQIQMLSFGKEHPAVVGDNDHAWSLNRRVNLIYKAN